MLQELVFNQEFIHNKDIAHMTFQTLSIESNTSFEMSSLLLNSNGNAFFSAYSLVLWTLKSWDYSISLKIKELKS